MEIGTEAAVAASGLAGAVVVGGFTDAMRCAGATDLDYGRILGAALGEGGWARPLGRALFLLNGAPLALGYRIVLGALGMRPSPVAGAALGVVHGVVALAGLAAGPRLHPRPSRAGLREGEWRAAATAVTLVAGHVLFGAIVGAGLRGADRRRRPQGALRTE
jgi:hypothetical protein